MRGGYCIGSYLREGYGSGKPVVFKCSDQTILDTIQQDIYKPLVTIIFRCLVDKGEVHFFVYVYLLPDPLTVDGIILADMLVGQGSTILYQITLDDGIVAKGPAGRIELDIRSQDHGWFGRCILDRSYSGVRFPLVLGCTLLGRRGLPLRRGTLLSLCICCACDAGENH